MSDAARDDDGLEVIEDFLPAELRTASTARGRPEPPLPKPDYVEQGWPIKGWLFMLPVVAFAAVCLALVLR